MKVKVGAIVAGVSGKLGGQMFQNNATGVVMKNIGSYSKKTSNAQTLQRKKTLLIMSLWSNITAEERALWELASLNYSKIDRFGSIKKFNGFQIFNRINQSLSQNGQALVSAPLPFHHPTFPIPVTVFPQENNIVLVSDAYGVDDIIEIYATPSLQNGKSSVAKDMRYITSVTSVQLANGVDIYSDYVTVFGSPRLGFNIFVGVKTVSNISYYSNKLLYYSSGNVGVPVSINSVFRLRARVTDFSPTGGGLIWLKSPSGSGYNLINSVFFTQNTLNFVGIPAYINPVDYMSLFGAFRRGNMQLTVTLPNKTYLVRVYTGNSEPALDFVGARIFNIVSNGVLAVANLDVVALFGGQTTSYVEFVTTVSAGSLVLGFQPVVNDPIFRAIEILEFY